MGMGVKFIQGERESGDSLASCMEMTWLMCRVRTTAMVGHLIEECRRGGLKINVDKSKE